MPEKGNLLVASPAIINVGLEVFADDLQELGFQVVQVDWRPPAGGDSRLTDLLSRLGKSRKSNSEEPS